ncbi:MAG: VOC family protein [Actinomycetota bacterium]|nr:VOC family protein [Actinomycetota bacterium]
MTTTSRLGADQAPAPPASYAPQILPATTTMSAVTLHAADLNRLAAYYREALGLMDVATDNPSTGASRGEAGRIVLGSGNTRLVVLEHTPDLPLARPGQAGLFHTALLFPDRSSLAATVARTARHPRSRFVGSADHLVSNAFYFTDPEGNGIELYWDRPRDTWAGPDGRLRMDTLPLDPNSFLTEHLDRADFAPDAVADIGHVHLRVGDLARAKEFYADVLGFEVTTGMPGALFVSAGGYHHHLGLNTWQSAGAGPRAATIGLGQVAITVPDNDGLANLADRLRRHRVAIRDDGRTLRFEDPWNSLIEVSSSN